MALLPTLGYEYTEREVTDTFRGYNHQLKIDEGEFYDMRNLTSACFPLLSNRKKRGRVRTDTDGRGVALSRMQAARRQRQQQKQKHLQKQRPAPLRRLRICLAAE